MLMELYQHPDKDPDEYKLSINKIFVGHGPQHVIELFMTIVTLLHVYFADSAETLNWQIELYRLPASVEGCFFSTNDIMGIILALLVFFIKHPFEDSPQWMQGCSHIKSASLSSIKYKYWFFYSFFLPLTHGGSYLTTPPHI